MRDELPDNIRPVADFFGLPGTAAVAKEAIRGDGALAVTMAARGAIVTGVDADPAMLVAARQRAEAAGASLALYEGWAEELPFSDASFDVVVAVTVLCFARAPGDALREMTRVLRPGGRLVLGELGRWSFWAARRRIRAWLGNRVSQKAHFRGPAALRRLTAEAGLIVECIEGAVFYPPMTGIARLIAPLDRWIGAPMLFGTAFLAVAASRPLSHRSCWSPRRSEARL